MENWVFRLGVEPRGGAISIVINVLDKTPLKSFLFEFPYLVLTTARTVNDVINFYALRVLFS